MDLGMVLGIASFALLVIASALFCWQQRDTPASIDDPNQMQPGDEIPEDGDSNKTAGTE